MGKTISAKINQSRKRLKKYTGIVSEVRPFIFEHTTTEQDIICLMNAVRNRIHSAVEQYVICMIAWNLHTKNKRLVPLYRKPVHMRRIVTGNPQIDARFADMDRLAMLELI